MAISAQSIFDEAMQLSEDERGELILNLLDSYGSPPSPVETEDRVWLQEIERRARAAQAGERGIPWEDVRSTIQRRLAGG